MTTQRQAEPITRLGEANLFDFTGPIVVNYSRSSITGGPRFSYRDAELRLSFTDDEITRVDTAVGELVTVTLQVVPDALTRTFTVLVPKVELQRGRSVEFDAIGIETVDRSSRFVPGSGSAGARQTYRVHDVRGVAQLVDF